MKTLYSVIIILLFFGISLKAQFRPIDTLTGKVVHYTGVYAGAASILEDKLFGFSLHGEYEYRMVKSSFGFGLALQMLFSDMTEIGVGFPVYWHGITSMNLRFSLTPGVTITKRVIYSRIGPGTSEFEETKNTTNFFVRAGLGWETFIYRDADPVLVLTPILSFDIISESEVYMGIGASLSWIIY
ncbi:MAG: hypothetical protein A2X61_01060 [Ignavibacteria bacterium GWB2_35_12]|nr:MAG: hypothetical protein A2X61_01060 [Ignavibacteria bacterium GWB2_35_12]OGU87916.1 MAG: hypothetical protein A2220_10385 [Ignavibacteria bacterium RIFOXYA2_FULL_35_10]OGV21778.1 MAG: hypothetical protein A2475_04285 [Ignavibacteria bacterium RIFOXYC2_FULL_35_21]